MKNNKGFTMIEILTVVIILGVLMVLAVPSVSEYIIESRKETYVSTIRGYVNALKYKINNFEYSFGSKDTTYYVHVNNIPLEKGGDSPFGEWEDAYVAVTFNGVDHTYYWVSKDTAGYMVKLKLAEDITVDDIILDSELLVSSRYGIEEREKVQIIGSSGSVVNTSSALEITYKEADECYLYTVNSGKITITSYDESCPKDVEIPATIGGLPVTTLGSYAFSAINLETVKIPDGVTHISGSAFRSNKITSVKFPSTLVSLGSEAFANNLITSISLPGGVSIGAGAFTNNKIPEESAMIYKMNADGTSDYSTLIGYAGSSKDIVIPDKVHGVELKKIESSAFRGLGITSVVIPDTVEYIGWGAFNSNKLTEVKLPSNLKTISSAAFVGNRLTGVDIPPSVTSLATYSFNVNQFPDDTAFIYKRNSDGSIDYSTLISYAGANKYVTIPSNVTKIADYAFFAVGLKSITIPDTVTSISNIAFNNNQLPPEQAFIYKRSAGADGKGVIDYSTIISYGGSNRGASTPVVVPQTVNGVDLKVIGANSFNQTSIKSIVLPDTVTTIESGAFSSCYITEFIIPRDLTSFASGSLKKESTWGNFNMLTKITNKSGRSFNWTNIVGGRKAANFVTGTIEHDFGNIVVVSG